MKYHVPAKIPINKFQKSQTQQSQIERLRSEGERAHLTGARPGLARWPGWRDGLGSRDCLGRAWPGALGRPGSLAGLGSGDFFSPISIFSDVLVVFFLSDLIVSLFCFWVFFFFFSGCPLMFWFDFILFIRVINRVYTRFLYNCHVEKYATSVVIRS